MGGWVGLRLHAPHLLRMHMLTLFVAQTHPRQLHTTQAAVPAQEEAAEEEPEELAALQERLNAVRT